MKNIGYLGSQPIFVLTSGAIIAFIHGYKICLSSLFSYRSKIGLAFSFLFLSLQETYKISLETIGMERDNCILNLRAKTTFKITPFFT